MSEIGNYKPNSLTPKEDVPTQHKRVEKPVAVGKVKKKSEIRKFSDVFLADDIGDVGRFIVSDVVIPTVKNLFYDVIESSLKMALFGDRGRTKRSGRTGEYVSYDRMSRRDDRNYRDEPVVRSRYSYNDIVLDTRGEAEDVLSQMDAIIENYDGMVSVADLYDLVGHTGDYTDHKYGWTNLRNAEVVRVRDGYMLKLPKAIPLK